MNRIRRGFKGLPKLVRREDNEVMPDLLPGGGRDLAEGDEETHCVVPYRTINADEIDPECVIISGCLPECEEAEESGMMASRETLPPSILREVLSPEYALRNLRLTR